MRIQEQFKQLQIKNEKALIVYLTAGFPSVDRTIEILTEIEDYKVDFVELGMPFSDPLADGETIQQSSITAIRNGMTLANYFEVLKIVRQKTDLPIVYMLRHPFATVLSIVRLGWPSSDVLDSLFAQPKLVADYLEPFRHLVGETQDEFERWMLIWSIENYIPLEQLKPGDVHLVFYEKLLADPLGESRRLLDNLHISLDEAAIQSTLYEPSATSRTKSAVLNGDNPITNWQKKVTEEQVTRGLSILHEFGLDQLYNYDPMPLTETPFLLPLR